MSTFIKKQLCAFHLFDPELGYATRRVPEGASQTWVAGAPIVMTSGLATEAADPVTALYAFALEAGQNTTGAKTKILPVVDGVAFYGNFLASGGADNTLAAADLDAAGFRIAKGAYGDAGQVIWFIEDTGTTTACKITSFETDQHLPNIVNNTYAAVGDTNARVTAIVLDAVRSYD